MAGMAHAVGTTLTGRKLLAKLKSLFTVPLTSILRPIHS